MTTDITHLPQAEFVEPGPKRQELIEKILTGEKRATASLQIEYEIAGEELPLVGQHYAVVNSLQHPVAVIAITAVEVRSLAAVDLVFARSEGEGFETVSQWRAAHEEYWQPLLPEIRKHTGNPTWQITDTTPVVLEWFELLAEQETRASEIL